MPVGSLDGIDLPDSKKKYISEKVNPVLEDLVRTVLTKMPDDPLPFMIKHLRERSGRENVDLEAVKADCDALQAEISFLENKLSEVGSQAADLLASTSQEAPKDEESEEDDDDEIEEVEIAPTNNRMRASVSAEAYGEWNKKKEFTPPKHPKSEEQRGRIKGVLSKNFMFQNLAEEELTIIVDAVEEVIIAAQDTIIKQGDDGDFMFVIESGSLECVINKDDTEVVVKVVEAGDAFGELALLYNAPRAASVRAKERCVCWKLDRETFNHIVKEAAAKKRDMFMDFLKQVPLLNQVDAWGRSQVADALSVEERVKGDVLIQQGEEGDKFYIVEKGSCLASKTGSDGTKKELELKEGDFFGELALLNNEPRAATVTATSDKVKLLVLKRIAFTRLLGSLHDILKEAQNRY
jgi:cAMP-dependent protein kinase regulator